jgi:hypothetical protein
MSKKEDSHRIEGTVRVVRLEERSTSGLGDIRSLDLDLNFDRNRSTNRGEYKLGAR